MAVFFRNCVRCALRAPGSLMDQKECPAIVVGISEAPSATAEVRGMIPQLSVAPAAVCSAPLARTAVSFDSGRGTTLRMVSSVGAAWSTRPPGVRAASNPSTAYADPVNSLLTVLRVFSIAEFKVLAFRGGFQSVLFVLRTIVLMEGVTCSLNRTAAAGIPHSPFGGGGLWAWCHSKN